MSRSLDFGFKVFGFRVYDLRFRALGRAQGLGLVVLKEVWGSESKYHTGESYQTYGRDPLPHPPLSTSKGPSCGTSCIVRR